MIALEDDLVIEGDNAAVLPLLPDGAFDLIYIDPPFNTGRERRRGELAYADSHADYLAFLRPRLEHARRLLAEHGTLYLHLDHREAHRVKLCLDEVFGERNFLNELIWAYDYGGRPRDRWPAQHDTIPVYPRERGPPRFDTTEGEPEPHNAPGLLRPREAARREAPGPGRPGEGGARQGAGVGLVVDDRAHDRSREDRLPDAEARSRGAPNRRGVVAAGRLVPGLLRRVGDARRGGGAARPPLRAGRLES